MAVAYTVTGAPVGLGPFRCAYGTFTSAAGDGSGETLTAATHGITHVVFAAVFLDPGGIGAPHPKIEIASTGTITWTVDDTLGYSGRWFVLGK